MEITEKCLFEIRGSVHCAQVVLLRKNYWKIVLGGKQTTTTTTTEEYVSEWSCLTVGV